MKLIIKTYFTAFEKWLWGISVVLISLSFFIGGGTHSLSLIASLIGVTALIFLAKGNVIGQILTVVFSVFYGIISYDLNYFGEMLTYLLMTAPMALLATISWLAHPFKGKKTEVEVMSINKKTILKILVSSIVITFVFYFVLKYFDTAYLPLSTASVTTSFIAVALTYYRSEFYALGYCLNDIVLILLWSLATAQNISYLTMVFCFIIFLVNDFYAFFNWRKIKKRQAYSN